ncbi:hypothetical protein EUGRSUZ_D00015 [Eucalyptus grandis]|uniref:Uncharacterized protein n=1 Tax=Eucalyptus grandis TaxID=71139 RepID=A0A059CBU4_EUCGR|nr:hypothetical protein EUGRSUZ_D00015 [Eucalyptus grandis]
MRGEKYRDRDPVLPAKIETSCSDSMLYCWDRSNCHFILCQNVHHLFEGISFLFLTAIDCTSSITTA